MVYEEFGIDPHTLLSDLEEGIDVGKREITAMHNFQIKLAAIDPLLMPINFGSAELSEFSGEIGQEVANLEAELRDLEKEEIHMVAAQQAMAKQKSEWLAHHGEKVEAERQTQNHVEKEILKSIHRTLQRVIAIFNEEEAFTINPSTGKITVTSGDEEEQELANILERLFRIILTYEQVFKELLSNG